MRIQKWHGLGNDFVMVWDPHLAPELVRAIADRRTGVGFDQLVQILPNDDASQGVAARVFFFNADGSAAGACGNATRCVAALLLRGQPLGAAVVLRTERGLLRCVSCEDGAVEVDMLAPLVDWAQVPLACACDTLRLPLEGAPSAVSMGNPHCVHFVSDLAAVDVESWGAAVERNTLFPQRTNVQFAQVLSRQHVRVRVWERGVGITRASGSSSCAVVVCGVRRGLLERRAVVDLDGGQLLIHWRESDGHVLMTGPAECVFDGTLDASFVARTMKA